MIRTLFEQCRHSARYLYQKCMFYLFLTRFLDSQAFGRHIDFGFKAWLLIHNFTVGDIRDNFVLHCIKCCI